LPLLLFRGRRAETRMGNRRGGWMTVSKTDKKPKQNRKSGKLLEMPDRADGMKPALEGEVLPPETETAAQGPERAVGAEIAPEAYKGAKKALRHALKAKVKAQREQIAETLVEKMKKGDMKGTEIVLTLMEKPKEENAKKKKKRDGPSWAELLVSEPEYDPSMEDDTKKLTAVSGE